MAVTVLTNARVWLSGVDLTGASNSVDLPLEMADQDTTTFGSNGWEESLSGLAKGELAVEGFWEAGDPTMVDDASWAQLGGIWPATVSPDGATVGNVVWAAQLRTPMYKVGGKVGDVHPWATKGPTTGLVGRGQLAHPPGTARTASGTGTSLNLGAVPDGGTLAMAVHVLSVSGTLSITPRLETDTATGFPSATTAATGTAVVAAGAPSGQWLTAAGPITDTWQRVAWTCSGTGSALFVASIVIA